MTSTNGHDIDASRSVANEQPDRIRRACRVAARWLTLPFALAVVAPLISQFVGPHFPHLCDAVELPLGGLQGPVIDSQDRVYVGVGAYSRIQVYGISGRFLNGFFITGGAKRLGLDADDNLCVVNPRNDRMVVYSAIGQIVDNRPGGQRAYRQWSRGPQWSHDSKGRKFTVRRAMYDPRIVTVAPDGEEQIFLANSFYTWPWTVGAFPCLLILSLLYKYGGGPRKSLDHPESPSTTIAGCPSRAAMESRERS